MGIYINLCIYATFPSVLCFQPNLVQIPDLVYSNYNISMFINIKKTQRSPFFNKDSNNWAIESSPVKQHITMFICLYIYKLYQSFELPFKTVITSADLYYFRLAHYIFDIVWLYNRWWPSPKTTVDLPMFYWDVYVHN